MRNLKRVLSLALAAVMLLGMMVMGTSAANVSDFSDADQIGNLEAASIVTGLGIFVGDTSGNFDPQRPVTRAEMATIICKILYGSNVNGDNFKGTGTFTDAKTYQGGWAEGYINMCKSQGIVNGYNDTTFGAADTVTTWQAALMLQRALGYWNTAAGEAINELSVTGLATNLGLYGDLTLSVDAPLNREDVAVLVFNALFAQRVHYDDVRGLYTKDNDRNVVVNNGTNDEMNTLAQNTFGLYSVDGIVTENGYTNMYLTGKTLVEFAENKDVTGDSRLESNYSFEYATNLDFIGHAVTVYYRIDRKAPVVYTIVDQAVKVETATVGSNFSTTVSNAGFSRDTSKTVIVLNYDLTNEDPHAGHASPQIGCPVILISNNSSMTVDYAIILDQELDYVTQVRVNNADPDNPVTTYALEVNGRKVDDTNVVALGDVKAEEYVIVTKVEDRAMEQEDLYIIQAAPTEVDTITKVTRNSSSQSTTALASEGVNYKRSAVSVAAGMASSGSSYTAGHTTTTGISAKDYAVTPYRAVLSKDEYILIFDTFEKLIAVAPVEAEHEVNAAYVAQFGYKINTNPSLNDAWVLQADIYFADGTHGIYIVDTDNPDCVFHGTMSDGGKFTLKSAVDYNGTTLAATSGNALVVNTASDNQNDGTLGSGSVPGFNNVNTDLQNIGPFIRLYDVTVSDDIALLQNLETSIDPSKITQIKRGVTYMGDESGTDGDEYYGNSLTTFFCVDGKYGDLTDPLNVGIATGMASVPTIGFDSTTNVKNDTTNTKGYLWQAFYTARTGYRAVDSALVSGYQLANAEEGVFFYNTTYTTVKTNGAWNLEIKLYNAVTGEPYTLVYEGYLTEQKARDAIDSTEIGFYKDSGNKNKPLETYANESTDTSGLTLKSGVQYAHDSTFKYFIDQGDGLTMYTAANNTTNGVVATNAQIIDLSGNKIETLEELAQIIKANQDTWPSDHTNHSKTAKVSYSYDNTTNQATTIFVTWVVGKYRADLTGEVTASDDPWVDLTTPADVKAYTAKDALTVKDAVNAIRNELIKMYGEGNVNVKIDDTDPAKYIFTCTDGNIPLAYLFDSDTDMYPNTPQPNAKSWDYDLSALAASPSGDAFLLMIGDKSVLYDTDLDTTITALGANAIDGYLLEVTSDTLTITAKLATNTKELTVKYVDVTEVTGGSKADGAAPVPAKKTVTLTTGQKITIGTTDLAYDSLADGATATVDGIKYTFTQASGELALEAADGSLDGSKFTYTDNGGNEQHLTNGTAATPAQAKFALSSWTSGIALIKGTVYTFNTGVKTSLTGAVDAEGDYVYSMDSDNTTLIVKSVATGTSAQHSTLTNDVKVYYGNTVTTVPAT